MHKSWGLLDPVRYSIPTSDLCIIEFSTVLANYKYNTLQQKDNTIRIQQEVRIPVTWCFQLMALVPVVQEVQGWNEMHCTLSCENYFGWQWGLEAAIVRAGFGALGPWVPWVPCLGEIAPFPCMTSFWEAWEHIGGWCPHAHYLVVMENV